MAACLAVSVEGSRRRRDRRQGTGWEVEDKEDKTGLEVVMVTVECATSLSPQTFQKGRGQGTGRTLGLLSVYNADKSRKEGQGQDRVGGTDRKRQGRAGDGDRDGGSDGRRTGNRHGDRNTCLLLY